MKQTKFVRSIPFPSKQQGCWPPSPPLFGLLFVMIFGWIACQSALPAALAHAYAGEICRFFLSNTARLSEPCVSQNVSPPANLTAKPLCFLGIWNEKWCGWEAVIALLRHQSRLPLSNINTLENSQISSTGAFGILGVHPLFNCLGWQPELILISGIAGLHRDALRRLAGLLCNCLAVRWWQLQLKVCPTPCRVAPEPLSPQFCPDWLFSEMLDH